MVLRNIRAVLSFAAKEDNMSYKKAKVYSDGSHYIASLKNIHLGRLALR